MEISDEAGRSIAYIVFDAKIDPLKNLYISILMVEVMCS